MKRALIIGIDKYKGNPLSGCINDARKMEKLLSRHHNGARNFDCRLVTAPDDFIKESTLKRLLRDLFANEADIALFYFSGHGVLNEYGGYLMTQDNEQYDEGVSMREVLSMANNSRAREVVIILDCCHSGALGGLEAKESEYASLREGVSILASSRDHQLSAEVDNGGIFTSLVHDALQGGAADIRGNVNAASVFTYVDQALGAWDQRPMFKTNVSQLRSLRRCKPSIELKILHKLPGYFSSPEIEFQLDPSFEPDLEPENETNQQIFEHLQKCRAARIVEPVDEVHMFFAAKHSKSCKLTALGRFYWRLVSKGRI